MGKYKRLEVFYLSKPVYTADKPSDCHYCYFWTNGRKGCRLGRNTCYYLISLPPKPKSECDGCPYGDVYKRQVKKYLDGAEVVYGVRSRRDTDTFFKRFTDEGFYHVMNALGADIVFNHADYRLSLIHI